MEAEEGHAGAHRAECGVDELHLLARREEDQRLCLQVRAHEPEEHVELLLGLDAHVVLLEARRRGDGGLLVDADVLRVAKREARERLHVLRLRRREEQRLPLLRQPLHDRGESGVEAHVEDTIGLVEDEDAEVGRVEAGRLVKVLEEAPRRAHEQAHPGDPLRLLRLVLPTDDEARRQVVLVPEHAQDVEYLERELARGRDDQRAKAIEAAPSLPV